MSARPTPAAAACSAALLLCGLVWLWLARPPGTPALLAWFLLAALAGTWIEGVPNQVSLARAHLAGPGFAYALSGGPGLLPLAAVVALAGLSDVLDGTAARRLARPTRLGGALDPVVDGVFFGSVAVGLAAARAYPAWLAATVVLRYGLPAAAGAVLVLARRAPRLRHTPLGQVSTVLIGVLLGGVALLHGLGAATGPIVRAAELLIPLAALATFANLAWANRAALGVGGRPAERRPGPGG